MTALSAQTIMQLLSVSTRDKPNDDYEKIQFYYHLDHLGSSNYITNLMGKYHNISSMCRTARCSLKSALSSCASLLRLFL